MNARSSPPATEAAPSGRRSSPNDIQVISRMGSILSLFTPADPVHSLASLSSKSALPASTCHRIVTSLVRANVLAHRPEPGLYELGHEVRRLGQVASAQVRVGEPVYRMLRRLNQELDENTALSVYADGFAVVVERVESMPLADSTAGVGQRMALDQTASGQILLANLQDRTALAADGSGELIMTAAMAQRIRRIRDAEYAIGAGLGRGEITLAVPVKSHGQCVAALGISGSPERIHYHSTGPGIERMRVAARAIGLRPELLRVAMAESRLSETPSDA